MPRKDQKTGETSSKVVPISPALSSDTAVTLPASPADSLNLSEIFDRPAKVLPTVLFFEATRQYQPQHETMYYLYRRWPVIDTALTEGAGADSYIDKFETCPDGEVEILKKWGSGDYRLCFTDGARPRGQTRVAECSIKLRSDDFPPVLDVHQLVLGEPKNKSYVAGLRARNLLPDQKEDMDKGLSTAVVELAKQVNQNNKPAAGHVPQEAITAMQAAFQTSLDMLKSQVSAITSGGGSGNADMLKLLIDQQAKQQELFVRVLDSRGGGGRGSSVSNQLEEVLQIETVLDKLTARRGGGESVVSQLIAAAPVLFGLITHAATQYRAAAAAPAAVSEPQTAGMPSLPLSVASAVPVTATAVHPDGSAVPAPAAGPEPAPGAAPASLDPQAVCMQVLNAIGRGFDGADFATVVSMQYGDEAYQQVASLGAEGLLGIFMANPEVWRIASDHQEALKVFLAEFVEYGQGDDTGDEMKAAA